MPTLTTTQDRAPEGTACHRCGKSLNDVRPVVHETGYGFRHKWDAKRFACQA